MYNTEDYQRIFIPKNVTIVINAQNKGYIVDSDNKKSLESALLWARGSNFMTEEEMKARQIQILNYINDGFTLKLKEAAKTSSQSGKLSFWMCDITTPDGITFSVGVNSQLLCDLLLSTCFINGKCQEELKFGTKNSQGGFFCESMPAYKEYIQAEELRAKMNNASTTKYDPGDIVRTLSESKVYVGEMYKYFDIDCTEGRFFSWMTPDIGNTKITIYKKPQKLYVFASEGWNKSKPHEILDQDFLKKKPKRLLTGTTAEIAPIKDNYYNNLQNSYKRYIIDNLPDHWRPYPLLCDLQYGDDPNFSDERYNLIQNRIINCLNLLIAQHKGNPSDKNKIQLIIE